MTSLQSTAHNTITHRLSAWRYKAEIIAQREIHGDVTHQLLLTDALKVLTTWHH